MKIIENNWRKACVRRTCTTQKRRRNFSTCREAWTPWIWFETYIRRWSKTWARNYRKALPDKERTFYSFEKELKQPGSCAYWEKAQGAQESKWSQWQMLAKFKVKFWPFPGDPFAPTAPPQPTEAGCVRPSPGSSGPQDGGCSCCECPGIWGHLQVRLSFHSSWASALTARAPHLSFC